MNTKNTESEETTPGDCSSPGRMEKPDSGSSRHSGCPLYWNFESCSTSDPPNHEERVRPSSWDDSDDDWSPEHESNSIPSRIYSSDDKRFRGSVTSEINELKKQFIEFFEKIKDNKGGLETLRDEIETTSNIDRRQSPARIRRRTKSSSSLSPVPETKNQHFRETTEETSEPETAFDEIPSRNLGLDPKFYLNNFFTELRSKRISLNDSLPVVGKSEKEEPYYDGERIQMQDELNTPDAKEVDEPFCRTARKLSQILEVEESKKDLEKSSEESMKNTDLFLKSLKNSEKHDFSPLQTSRSKRSEKILENVGDTAKENQEKYKSMSSENVWNFQKVRKPFQESLSERTGRISDHKISDDFISLSAKTGKTRLVSTKWMDTKNHRPFQFVSPKATVKNFSQDPDSDFKEKDTVFDSMERLNLDLIQNLTPENQTSRRSTDRSEQSGSIRADSGRNCNSGSPKFKINIGKDSDRSLKLEDLCTPDSLKRSAGFKARSESKPDGNLALPLESPSLESVKSTSRRSTVQNFSTNISNRSGSSYRSQRRKERQRKNNLNAEPGERKPNFTFPIDKAEPYYSDENIQSCKKPNSISYRSGYSTGSSCKKTPKQYEHQFEKSARTLNSRSSISLNSDDTKSITAEDRLTENQIFDRETPRENGTPDLDLPIKISERTASQKALHRKENAIESDSGSKKSDRSETNMLKHKSRGSSKRGSSSRSGTSESSKSSPTCLKTPPNTNSGSSNKSKDSLENHDDYESAKAFRPALKELEKNCDNLSNHMSAGSDSKRSSWRELETSYQQYPFQKEVFSPENGASYITITPKYNEIQEERPSSSQESSRNFADSFASESLDVNTSTTFVSSKSRLTSQTSEKHKELDIHLDFEKLDLGALSERTTNRSITFEKDEETREHQSTQRSKSEAESDRYSTKKLSVISEASYENTETSNFSIENEDKDIWEQSRPDSKKDSEKFSHRRVSKTTEDTPDTSKRSSEEKFLEESTSQPNNSDGGRWNELIETFCTSPNSSILENTFPTFPYEKKNLWNSISEEVNTAEESEDNENLQNSGMFSTKLTENKYGSSEKNIFLEKELEADFGSRNLENENPLLEKISEQKDAAPVKNFQNLYYFNVEKEGSFGIGEFGDVTSWNSGKFNTVDFEKPKDHGDGFQTQRVSEVLALPGKKEKEVKTQRQLWTEFREDSRDLTALISKQHSDVENDRDSTQFIRVNLKTSKSDNCLTRKTTEGNECRYLANCDFLHETNNTPKKFQEFENNIERDKGASKSTIEKHSSVESLEFEKEDSENSEFDCERTPRLSRSMSSLNSRLKKENFEKRESNQIFQTSRTQLFEKSNDNSQTEKDFTNLNIFLAQKEKMTVKSNNWLSFKNPEEKKSRKQMQKTKTKKKRTDSLQKPFNEYLYSRESHSSVPHFKLRNSNCFQNFYKRFINVFCLTSTSSAATSK